MRSVATRQLILGPLWPAGLMWSPRVRTIFRLLQLPLDPSQLPSMLLTWASRCVDTLGDVERERRERGREGRKCRGEEGRERGEREGSVRGRKEEREKRGNMKLREREREGDCMRRNRSCYGMIINESPSPFLLVTFCVHLYYSSTALVCTIQFSAPRRSWTMVCW